MRHLSDFLLVTTVLNPPICLPEDKLTIRKAIGEKFQTDKIREITTQIYTILLCAVLARSSKCGEAVLRTVQVFLKISGLQACRYL